MTKDDYINKFPDARMVSEELSKKFTNNAKEIHRHLKETDLEQYMRVRKNTCKLMRDNKGDNFTHSQETIEKMRLSHIGVSNGGHSEATKEAIRQMKIGKPVNLSEEAKRVKTERQKKRWEERKSDPSFPDYIQRLSENRIQYIKEHGVNNPKKGRKTNIERKFINFLESYSIDYQYQYFLDGKYYDFYIPSMNYLVETDGEYWHRFDHAIKNDLEKHQIAKARELKLLRITSEVWKPELLLENNYEVVVNHNHTIMNKRTTECQNYQIPTSII